MVAVEMFGNEFRKKRVLQVKKKIKKVPRASRSLAVLFSMVSVGRAVISQGLFLVLGHLVTPLPTVDKRRLETEQSKTHTGCKQIILLVQTS